MDPRGSRNARACPLLARAECQVCDRRRPVIDAGPSPGMGADESENEEGGEQEALKLRPVLPSCAPETL